MKVTSAFVGLLLVSVGFLVYLYGIGDAIYITKYDLPGNPKAALPEPLGYLVTGLGAILLTNLGAVLGISVSNSKSSFASRMPFLAAADTPDSSLNSRERFQFIAVIVYLVGLVACLIAWLFFKSSTDPSKVLTIISEQVKTLFGVFLAYVATVIGVKQA